ncbi:MAG TPA: DUF6491 family protein [Alphaproteobacteria bacterium]|nr:DUF6491 family protein [Alphaproteobacteria bacterium]
MVRHFVRLGLVSGLLACAAIVGASESRSSTTHASTAQEARIPFAALGGIQNWVADGDKAIYIEGLRHQWYHAKLMGECLDLPFSETIGFVMEPDLSFNKFSAIVVRGHVCQVKSMVKSERPGTAASRKTKDTSSKT